MLKAFQEHLKLRFPELRDSTFLLACSGGLDSMVLAHLSFECKLDFELAHCNFGLRGYASDEDAVFVMDLANKMDKKVYITHFDTIGYIRKRKVSVQMAARELRYAWFAEIMTENKIGPLVTAHHADDNLETFFINLSRGTGINGLTGIPEKTAILFRPLLAFSRAQLLSYALKSKIEWREDASNEDIKYLRNDIRHTIIPLLKKLHPAFLDNFRVTLGNLTAQAQILENSIAKIRKELFVQEDDHFRISVSSLLAMEPFRPYLVELFKPYGFKEWDTLIELLGAMSSKEIRSATHRLIKDREHLLLQELGDRDLGHGEIFLEESWSRLPFELSCKEVDQMEERAKAILYVDKETLNNRLSIRKWKKGDYFYPLGMSGRKKVSKFFRDEKMDKITREGHWLLCNGEDVVWIIGIRADDRFKVTGKTRKILKFTLKE